MADHDPSVPPPAIEAHSPLKEPNDVLRLEVHPQRADPSADVWTVAGTRVVESSARLDGQAVSRRGIAPQAIEAVIAEMRKLADDERCAKSVLAALRSLHSPDSALRQTAQDASGAVGDLRAYGDGERDSALKAKDREQYQFWSGWVAALDRVHSPSAPPRAVQGPPLRPVAFVHETYDAMEAIPPPPMPESPRAPQEWRITVTREESYYCAEASELNGLIEYGYGLSPIEAVETCCAQMRAVCVEPVPLAPPATLHDAVAAAEGALLERIADTTGLTTDQLLGRRPKLAPQATPADAEPIVCDCYGGRCDPNCKAHGTASPPLDDRKDKR